MPNVLPLGLVGPMNLVQIEQHALEVIASYKNYSLIGLLVQLQLQLAWDQQAEVKLISRIILLHYTSLRQVSQSFWPGNSEALKNAETMFSLMLLALHCIEATDNAKVHKMPQRK